MEANSPFFQSVGRLAHFLYHNLDTIQMHLHLILSALFPIYIGSHASLRRPSSAAPKSSKSADKRTSPEDDEDDDGLDDEPEPVIEGMSPSDAILFPILAGITLSALYFIIKWMNDPALINRIMGWYFSTLGVFGVGKLAADALNVGTTFVFPSVWADRKGELYHVDQQLCQQYTIPEGGDAAIHKKFCEDKPTPLPGLWSSLNLSLTRSKAIWAIRALFTSHWILRGYIHGFLSLKQRVRMNDAIGLLIGASTIALYNTHILSKAWWLTNIMGFGFSYGTLQLMSPTTFKTGTLVLAGLFIYDVVMVFYTPMMVTVATTLDVPIKLVFPGPNRGSMLGLGDVVLPGIVIALALRFDLYLFYLRKTRTPLPHSATSEAILTNPSETKTNNLPAYIDATSHWGERFWTRSLAKTSYPEIVKAATFPKPYFTASIIGYVLGLLCTLSVLHIFHHAQPALLYLVPGVLGAVWGTALVRGETKEMLAYDESTESAEKEKANDKGNDKGKEGDLKNVIGGTEANAKGEGKGQSDEELAQGKTGEDGKGEEKRGKDEHVRHVFLFSLSEPRRPLSLDKLCGFEKSE